MIQFYAPDIEAELTLPESDSAHCCRVLRHQSGDLIQVVDGKGKRYTCRILSPHPKHTPLEIVDCVDVPLAHSQNITLAVAPTKNMDRMEWLVEKVTEIGINQIIPFVSENSERRKINIERLEKIAISAMKQSLKAVAPIIHPEMKLVRLIEEYASTTQKFICYCSDQIVQRRILAKEYRPKEDVVILIGPEGDFSPTEASMAIDKFGYTPVTLGDNRLRTETAALVAVDTCHIIDQLHS